MDENALIRDTRNAEQAQRILENEAFLSVVEQIKDRIWKKLPGAPVETLPVLQMELKRPERYCFATAVFGANRKTVAGATEPAARQRTCSLNV
jgi:predicted component of type VI protein secretion system